MDIKWLANIVVKTWSALLELADHACNIAAGTLLKQPPSLSLFRNPLTPCQPSTQTEQLPFCPLSLSLSLLRCCYIQYIYLLLAELYGNRYNSCIPVLHKGGRTPLQITVLHLCNYRSAPCWRHQPQAIASAPNSCICCKSKLCKKHTSTESFQLLNYGSIFK